MSPSNRADEFYVGYRPLPPKHRVFVALCIPACMLALSVAAAVMATSQRDPGDAVWNASEERVWSGTLVSDPYPMLITDEGTVHLVVEMGKIGAHERAALAGEPVMAEVRGFSLHRSGRRIIELAPEPDAIRILEQPAGAPACAGLGPVVARGEIVDGKCFLGAMKPGDGTTHKACAVLCIQGGLPAMIAVRDDPTDPTPDEVALLLVDGAAGLPEEILKLVARPVEVRGVRSTIGDLIVIDAAAADIRPLP